MVTIAALMSAETGLGASGWARGSQACSGTRPALEPKPISARMKTPSRVPWLGCAWRSASKVSPCPAAASQESPARMATSPMCVMTAYQTPASRTASSRGCPDRISTSDPAAISSQAASSVDTEAAAGTSSRLTANSGHVACATRPDSAPWPPGW